MTAKWFIDALDSRGGLAVASQRERNLMQAALTVGGPSIFISPPAFVPEFLDSRAVGFGLARMQAQTGLFYDQVEVSFDSLPAVVEFVRRTYLRGAAGDGPAENGGPPVMPRPSPDERPPGETRDSGKALHTAWRSGKGPVDRLLEFANLAKQLSDQLENGESSPPPSPVGDATTVEAMPANQVERLILGGFWVLEELVRRRASPGTDEFVDWLISVNRLIELFIRMGLWFRNLPLPASSILQAYVERSSYDESEWPLRHLVDQLLTGRRPDYFYYLACRHCRGNADVFSYLAVLPAPPEMVPYAHADGQNLQALLSGLVAVPADIFSLHGGLETRTRCGEILLFATAALNLDGEMTPYAETVQSNMLLRRLIRRSVAWIDSNLPKLLFSQEVEDLIRSASRVPA